MNSIRSPFFYVGDKYKLMPQLKQLFPDNIGKYIEPFVGGGSSFLNTSAKEYYLNDLDPWIIKIHQALQEYVDKEDELLTKLFNYIDYYGLSCSYKGKFAPATLKKKYPKTYYAKFNKDAYSKLKSDFNNDKIDILKLYLLLIYGFNHMIRFNSSDDFNLPVGDVDFNKNVYNALHNYLEVCKDRKLIFENKDYKTFLHNLKIRKNKTTYVYCDPPYLISASEYNKYWTEKDEKELYILLDTLNDKGIKFGITNLVRHKGKTNTILEEWAKKYFVYNIKSNYISFNDNTIKADSSEVFITNYEKEGNESKD